MRRGDRAPVERREDPNETGSPANTDRRLMTVPSAGVHAQLHDRYGAWGDALFTLIAATVAIAISGLAAHLFEEPLLFPSLGPSVLLFFEQPLAPQSSPRNTLIGHAAAIVVGVAMLLIFGLWNT